MARLMAPRCQHRANPASFRVLMCRAHGTGCGVSWLATTAEQVVAKRTLRDAHEDGCTGHSAEAASATRPPTSATDASRRR